MTTRIWILSLLVATCRPNSPESVDDYGMWQSSCVCEECVTCATVPDAGACEAQECPPIPDMKDNASKECVVPDAGTCDPEPFSPALAGESGEELLTLPDVEQYCQRFGMYEEYEIAEGEPKNFLIYGFGIPYCVMIIRQSGYIALSHDVGLEARDDPLYGWCIEGTEEMPARLTVHSFTPTASFIIKLFRGEE